MPIVELTLCHPDSDCFHALRYTHIQLKSEALGGSELERFATFDVSVHHGSGVRHADSGASKSGAGL